MTQYMLLFSLGPVQPFIAQARKTRDLWFGSFLLSALMQESMKGLQNLVFPDDPIIKGNIPDLPNKYIAIFDDPNEAVRAAENSEKNIEKIWRAICNEVWDEVLGKVSANSKSITHTQWNDQVDPAHVFEIFWVVKAGNVEDYKNWLAETQLLFDRRKRLRNFEQQEEAGEKSTISGLRAALRGPEESRKEVQAFWRKIAKYRSAKDISLDGTERLDAIDTIKRFAHLSKKLAQLVNREELESGFPSTSSIATATFIESLIRSSNDESLQQPLDTWLEETRKLGETMPATIPLLKNLAKDYRQGPIILKRDGDCYFPETFSIKRLERDFRIDGPKEQLAKAGPKAVSDLLKATNALTPPITHPTSYYAMIQMDGDKMGKLINDVADKKEHQDISKALSVFSRTNAPDCVEGRYPGRLIYAGGDDVFALAPLARDHVQRAPTRDDASRPIKNVLDLVDQLQKQYCELVRNAVNEPAPPVVDVGSDPSDTPKPSRKALVTASTGIAIAHHYTSLSYVRRASKEAEQLAKNHYGRNALVVTVLRRSGEQTRVGCRWHYSTLKSDEPQPIPLFLSFYDLFMEDVLSPKCVFTLLEEAPALVGLKTEAQVSEIKRVLRRQRSKGMEERLSNDEIQNKANYLVALAEAMNADYRATLAETMNAEASSKEKKRGLALELHVDSRRYGLVEVLGWLLVMHFLARKEQE